MAGTECIKMFSLLFSLYFFNSSSLYSSSINRPNGLTTLVPQLAHLLCADVFQQAVGFTDVLRVSAHYYVDMLVLHLGACVFAV